MRARGVDPCTIRCATVDLTENQSDRNAKLEKHPYRNHIEKKGLNFFMRLTPDLDHFSIREEIK